MSHERLSVGPVRIGRVDLFALAPLVASLLVGVLVWPALPAEMAVHFSGGRPDQYVTRALGVWLVPVVGLAAIALVRLRDTPSTPVEDVTVGFVGWVVGGAHVYVLAWNLGYRVSTVVVLAPALGGAALLTLADRFGFGR